MYSERPKTNLYPSLHDLLLCPYCSLNFPSKRFNSHKKYCKQALRECPVCQDTYHIEETEEHRKTCEASVDLLNKFASLQSEENLRDSVKCQSCKKLIPVGGFVSHLNFCTPKKCFYCHESYRGKFNTHLSKCGDYKKTQQKSLQDQNTGANMKKRISDEPGRFHKITGAVKKFFNGAGKTNPGYCMDSHTILYPANANYNGAVISQFSDPQKTNPDHCTDLQTSLYPANYNGAVISQFSDPQKRNPDQCMNSQTNLYPTNYNEENFVPPSAPPEEIMYVSCEFCGQNILMDQDAIFVHESGCRPDFEVSAVSNEPKLYKSTHEAYHNDQANAFQKKGMHFEELQGRNVTPNDVFCEAHTYNYLKNFTNRNDTQKGISYQEHLEKNISK